ncbi:MAG: chromate transporter [Synergistaceae bacterium]|jgi:chromate transporter|nr:chromate transporter [Synergistaceae bacterium]
MVHSAILFEFLKTGLFSIGGGLATLPFLYSMADKYTWFTRETLVDMIAISESTPGAIGINMATYVGYSAGGISGGVLATMSLIAPSVIIVFFVSGVLDMFKENRFVKGAFYGARPAVTALVASAALSIMRMTLFESPDALSAGGILEAVHYKELLLFIVIFHLLARYKKHPVCYIAGAALAGALFKF